MSEEIPDDLREELQPDDTREICDTDTFMRPCPFCGEPPVLLRNPKTSRFHVQCVNEDCIMASSDRSPTKEEAVAMWNARYNEPPVWTPADITYFDDRLRRITESKLRLASLCRKKEYEGDALIGSINYQLFCPKCGKREYICLVNMNNDEWQISCDCGYYTTVGTVETVLKEFMKAWQEKK